jgi:hypothetical protein
VLPASFADKIENCHACGGDKAIADRVSLLVHPAELRPEPAIDLTRSYAAAPGRPSAAGPKSRL